MFVTISLNTVILQRSTKFKEMNEAFEYVWICNETHTLFVRPNRRCFTEQCHDIPVVNFPENRRYSRFSCDFQGIVSNKSDIEGDT